MALIPAFNPADIPKDDREFGCVPTGEYPALMVDSDMKDVKPPKTGQYLEAVFEISEGEHKGRKLWARFNLINPSEDAQRIAYQQLSAICEAVGHRGELRESSALHYKPLIIRVEFYPAGTVKKNGYTYDRDTNEIKAYKAIAGGLGNATNTTRPQSSAPATTASPSNASAAPPWANKAA